MISKKKSNIYSKTQLNILKDQLVGMVEYLESFDMEKITDRLGNKTGPTGSLMIIIVSSIEDQVKTALSTVKQSIGIIITIYEQEGLNDWLEEKTKITIDKLEQIKSYYFNLRPNNISDRVLTEPNGFTRNGSPKYAIIYAATKEKIIESKNKFTEMILQLLPQIDIVSSMNKATARGGVDVPESMLLFMERMKNGEVKEE